MPAIIPEKTFDKVQAILKSRDPKMLPARSHSSPVLLSGIGRCGNPGCDGTMMLMNGKGGQYRYYACSNVRRKKDRSCGGNNVQMSKVDDAVLEVLQSACLILHAWKNCSHSFSNNQPEQMRSASVT